MDVQPALKRNLIRGSNTHNAPESGPSMTSARRRAGPWVRLPAALPSARFPDRPNIITPHLLRPRVQ